jgi:hypothetical protein
MHLAACHHFSPCNFDVAHRFRDHLCASLLGTQYLQINYRQK